MKTPASVEITSPAPNVMCTYMRGHVTALDAAKHMHAASAAYARGSVLHHFFDCEAMTSYDSQARVELTAFALKHRAHVASSTFLVRNKLVAMGVSTAALAARFVGLEFVMVSDRATFEAKLASHTRRR